jgi:hypothetical protein
LQSRPRPHNYTRRSVRAHIPVPARNVRAHIPVPAASVRTYITVCAIGVRARPSFPSAPAFPLSPTRSAPDIPYAPLCPRPAIRLRPLPRQRGSPRGSQRGQVKSDLPWPPVNARLTLTGRARRSIGHTGRAGGPPHRQPWAWVVDRIQRREVVWNAFQWLTVCSEGREPQPMTEFFAINIDSQDLVRNSSKCSVPPLTRKCRLRGQLRW